MKNENSGYRHTVVGVAWYRAEQWQRLREISADRKELEDSYQEWVRNVERAIKELNRNGIQSVKVAVEVEELLKWCQSRNKPVNGEARADFVSEKLQSGFEENG
jgi:hypothetical protein